MNEPELTLENTYEAPAKDVFLAWTKVENLKKWCCPQGMIVPFAGTDPRRGGEFKLVMQNKDGKDFTMRGVYKELHPPKKLLFTQYWDNPDGPSKETTITITLDEEDGKTKMTFHQVGFRNEEVRDEHVGGWKSAFESLGEFIKKD